MYHTYTYIYIYKSVYIYKTCSGSFGAREKSGHPEPMDPLAQSPKPESPEARNSTPGFSPKRQNPSRSKLTKVGHIYICWASK